MKKDTNFITQITKWLETWHNSNLLKKLKKIIPAGVTSVVITGELHLCTHSVLDRKHLFSVVFLSHS
jgi:S-adenosylmethionine/arginine decarboxylase-like enzyme